MGKSEEEGEVEEVGRGEGKGLVWERDGLGVEALTVSFYVLFHLACNWVIVYLSLNKTIV